MHHVDPAVACLTLRGFGSDAEALRAAARGLPHVTIGDKIDDLAAFLATTDAIVVPSSFEPFGQVALEARLAGRPLIVADVDGLPEQVDPAAGIVVTPDNPVALAAAIVALATLRNGASWTSACNAARASATPHIAESVRRWTMLLHQVRARLPIPGTEYNAHRQNSVSIVRDSS